MANLRQRFHLEPPRGLLNDPNGLTYFKGEYHVFFQWNRFEKNHSYKEWGHFVSKDFLTWDFLGSALLPDQQYDKDGVYSGSAEIINEELYLYYTGNSKDNGNRKSYQCLAISKEGRKILKKGPVLETPEGFTEHFRDPKVIKIDTQYWMVVGAQRSNGKGAIAICHSNNGVEWIYKHTLMEVSDYEMIECPDIFKVDSHHVLLFCPQRRDNDKDTYISSFAAYQLGDFEETKGIFRPIEKEYKQLDYGFDFYAPQTFIDANNRRIMIAWMSNMDGLEEAAIAKASRSVHCLTMPREVHIRSGKLYQKPIQELYSLLGDRVEVVNTNHGYTLDKTASHFKLNRISSDLEIALFNDNFTIQYDTQNQKLVMNRRNWVTKNFEKKCIDIDRIKNMEFWMDSSSVEIFINDGEFLITSRVCAKQGRTKSSIKSKDCNMRIEAHRIRHFNRIDENFREEMEYDR